MISVQRTLNALALALAVALSPACDSESTSAAPDADAAAAEDAGLDITPYAGPAEPDVVAGRSAEGPCGPLGVPVTGMVSVLTIPVQDDEGLAAGMDMDGVTTEFGDDSGCGQEDLTSPDGREGIDNQFAVVVPQLASIGLDQLDADIQRAIMDGNLVLLMDVASWNGAPNDDCVTFSLYQAAPWPKPIVDPDGFAVAGQSFDVDWEQPWIRIDRATVTDGILEAGPFPLDLPLTFFDQEIDVYLDATWVRATVDAEGHWRGTLGAYVTLDSLMSTIEQTDQSFAELAGPLLGQFADMLPDDAGDCQAISLAFAFEAVRAHLYEGGRLPRRSYGDDPRFEPSNK